MLAQNDRGSGPLLDLDFPLSSSSCSSEYLLDALLTGVRAGAGVSGSVLVEEENPARSDDDDVVAIIVIGDEGCICCCCFFSSSSFQARRCFSSGYRGTLDPARGESTTNASRENGW